MRLFPYLLGTHRLDKCRRHTEFLGKGNVGTTVSPYKSSLFRGKLCLSRIAALFCYRSPTAITWGISGIVIDTLKSEARRFLTHVGKKIFKTVQPSLANFYATIAIIFGHRMPVIGTSRLHVDPCRISARLGHSMSGFRSTWVHDSSSTERLWKVTGQCLSTGPLRFVA